MKKKHLFIGIGSALGAMSITFISLFVWKSATSGKTPEPEPQAVEHFITFESNGGTHVATQRVKDGGKATEPTEPTRPDHQFGGWFDNPELVGSTYNFDNVVTNDVTLYARWIGGTVITTYKIDFQGENCSTTLDPKKEYEPGTSVEFKINIDDTTKYKLPEKINVSGSKPYEYNSNTGTVNLVIGNSNALVVAIAKELTPTAKHKVSFVLNGGTGTADPIEVTEGELVPTEDIPKDPTKAGYPFEGWSISATSKNIFKFEETPIVNDLILYAWWGNIKTYTVKFYDEDTEYVELEQTVKYGENVQRPVNPIKDGHTFDNWYTAKTKGSLYPFDTPLTGESSAVNIYARFKLNKCNITYVLSGCTIEGTESVDYGATIPAAPTVKIGDKQIYPTWWTTPDFTEGSQFKFGAAGTGDPVKGDLILYGKYVPTAESFVNDPWDLFTSYIDSKTFGEISGEGSPYHDEFISTEGKKANTFVGLSRTLTFTDEKGEDVPCQVLVIDENKEAEATDNKFTFMITDLGLETTFAENNNFYPNSYINSYLDILLWMFPAEVKQHMQTITINCYNMIIYPQHEDPTLDPLSTSLYIPSASQIFGESASGEYPTENNQFAYFKNGGDKTILNNAWLRTPDKESPMISRCINNASLSEDYITESHELMPVFVIK